MPEVNSIKNKMSIAYMHALNSTINYAFNVPQSDFDGLGFDIQVCNKTVGTSRKIASEANQINIQLKSVSINSHTMINITDDGIEYSLADDLIAIGTHYLVVIVLQSDDEIENWRTVNEDDLTINARAYYTLIDKIIKKGKVKIPNSNILNPESYIGLFAAANNKDAV